MTGRTILQARTDAADRLVEADDGFASLVTRAGGGLGEQVAIPQVASLARLARRLGIVISRGVTVADGDADLDCWIKARPVDHGVALALSVLRERSPWNTPAGASATPVPPAGADWEWRIDRDLIVRHVAGGGGVPADAVGAPLTAIATLDPDGDGQFPILTAVAACTDFVEQRATLRASGARVTLAGSVARAADGSFAGFVGGVYPLEKPTASIPAAPLLGTTVRLDRILRGPLSRIVANADSIGAGGDGPISPHYTDYAADIGNAARHLLGLVDDLADLDAIERDDFAIERDEIDLAEIGRRAAGLLAVRAADAGVTIDRGPDDVSMIVRGEFRRLLQIFVNLLANAVRFSPEGGTIWLRFQQDGDRSIAIVADQGKGIDPADHARIFDKFAQVDPGHAGGSGLGLHIARRLARAMDGELTVDSAPAQGARFILSLPRL